MGMLSEKIFLGILGDFFFVTVDGPPEKTKPQIFLKDLNFSKSRGFTISA